MVTKTNQTTKPLMSRKEEISTEIIKTNIFTNGAVKRLKHETNSLASQISEHFVRIMCLLLK